MALRPPPISCGPTTVSGAPCHHREPKRGAWASVSQSAPPLPLSPHHWHLGRKQGPSTSPHTPALPLPRRPPPNQGWAYLSNTARVVLGLGAGPEQAGGRRGRPQLQDPAEVRGVGGGAAGSGGRGRVGLLSLGGQAELLGSPAEDRWAALGAVPVPPAALHAAARPTLFSLARWAAGLVPGGQPGTGQARRQAEQAPARPRH